MENTLLLALRGDRRKTPERALYRRMVDVEVRALKGGAQVSYLDGRGRVATVRIGKVRTWKRDPERVEVSCKFGLYEYFTLSLGEATQRLLVEVPLDGGNQ